MSNWFFLLFFFFSFFLFFFFSFFLFFFFSFFLFFFSSFLLFFFSSFLLFFVSSFLLFFFSSFLLFFFSSFLLFFLFRSFSFPLFHFFPSNPPNNKKQKQKQKKNLWRSNLIRTITPQPPLSLNSRKTSLTSIQRPQNSLNIFNRMPRNHPHSLRGESEGHFEREGLERREKSNTQAPVVCVFWKTESIQTSEN